MKLSEWARRSGLTYKTAHRLFHKQALPIRAEQLSTGTILVYPEEPTAQRVSIYGRVSSNDQKEDLGRQLERLRSFCAAKGWPVANEVTDIGSGLNEGRTGILRLLSDPTTTHIVIEHRDRLARFGVELLQAALAAQNRHIVVMNENEFKNDIVQDFVEIVTSMCARIYGARGAANRAKRALAAVSK